MKMLNSKYIKSILLFFFVFTLFWAGWMMRSATDRLADATGNSAMLDTQPNANLQDVYHYMDRLGEEGRQVLVSIYKFEDFIFPMAYGPFLFLAIVYFFHKSFPKTKYLLFFSFVPLIMVCFDYIENFSLIRILEAYPNQIPSTAALVGKITLAKWIAGLLSVILGLVGFAIFIRRNYFPKKD